MHRFLTLILIFSLFWLASCSDSSEITRGTDAGRPTESTGGDDTATTAHSPTPTQSKEVLSCTERLAPLKHEPPIGTGKGSIFFDMTAEQDFVLTPIPSPVPSPTPPPNTSVYRIKPGTIDNYTHIECISILTEDEEPHFKVFRFTEVDGNRARLKLWLGNVPNQHSGPADLIIQCNPDSGRGPCWLFARKQFDNVQIGRPEKIKRPKRKSYRSRDKFITKWELEGNVTDSEAGDDMYQIYILFGHR